MKKRQEIPECEDCTLKTANIFQALPKEVLEELSYEKGCCFYKRGNILYHEGNHINGCYCIHEGVIKLYKTGLEGREQIIRFAQKGDLIGFRSVLSGELACTTAKVIEDAVACFIPGSKLVELVKKHSDFSLDLMQLTCKELGEANKYILDIAQKTVRERLAEVLLLLRETFDLDQDNVLQIALTREELANMVGTATESIIRLLSEFKSDRLIEVHARKIKLLDIARLSRLANFPD